MKENLVKEVSVLGTRYKIVETDNLRDLDGETDFYDKVIRVRNVSDMLEDTCETWKKELRRWETLRHELVHAMLMQSGLTTYAYDETIVEWIAQKFEEMKMLFEGCDAI